MSDTTTTVEKRKATSTEIIGGVIGSLLLFVVAYFLFDADHGIWGALAAVVGVGVLIHAFGAKQTAACPNCKHQFDEISDMDDRWLFCPACEKYSEIEAADAVSAGSSRRLEIINDNYICEDFIFQVKVPRSDYFPKWPPGCCVCGKQAGKRGVAKHTFVNRGGSAVIQTVQMLKFEVSGIPYCEEHYLQCSEKTRVGVSLVQRSDDSKWLIKPEEGDMHVLAFQSYRYFRAFRALNRW
jgi:hypothetical protein